jgi:hypothetical protein
MSRSACYWDWFADHRFWDSDRGSGPPSSFGASRATFMASNQLAGQITVSFSCQYNTVIGLRGPSNRGTHMWDPKPATVCLELRGR